MGHDLSLRSRRFATALLVMVSAAGLAGCQPKTASLDGADTMATGSLGPDSLKKVAALGAAYQADPNNAGKAIAYANGLESIGQTERQMQVLQGVYQANSSDPKVAAIYGKKLLGAGRADDAIQVLTPVAAGSNADWRVHSALGMAYDQSGGYEQARAEYAKALALKPSEPSVLNNLGMSYIMQGDPQNAEQTLRKAAALPASRNEPRIRQNLALAVGLQGRFDEAREIASKDLPPDQVEANLAYLKKMLSKSNTWQQLSEPSQG